MSAAQFIDLLNKYVTVHRQLLQSGRAKTEALKKGDMERLTAIMKEEQKHVNVLHQLEKERTQLMEATGLSGNEWTFAACIERAEESEKSELQALQQELSAVVLELRDLNELNQQLIQQSLQFVHMTLDLILPQPPEVNYRHPNAAPPHEKGRSIFDSKA